MSEKPKTVLDWQDIPNVDWPHNLPRPSIQDIVDAAMHVSGHGESESGLLARQMRWVAMTPWLVKFTPMSGAGICRVMGRAEPIRRSDAWARVMLAPVGRSIAQAMGCRLREIVRERMEQTQ